MKQKILKYGAVASALATSAGTVLADSEVANLGISKIGDAGVTDIGYMIGAVFNAAIVIAVLFVFGMLIMGGYGWITAGGDKTKVEEARTRITNAIIGLAIVASAWALIAVIGNFFGVDINDISLPDATGNGTEVTS